MIDTHCHLDGEEFKTDLADVIARAREAGVEAIGVPGIDLNSCETVPALCRQYPGYCYPMLGLHPEEVRADWREVLAQIRRHLSPEVVAILKRYKDQLPGGVFHCFTGNALEAQELLQFDRFVLGVGGVSTFKKSPLPEVLPAVVPLDRLVLETDAPYMAPVPMRGQRNEPAFVAYVLRRLAEAYGVSEEEMTRRTNANCEKILNIHP